MGGFFLKLWLRWSLGVVFFSIFFASIISSTITFYLYLINSVDTINKEILSALTDIAIFWFPISFSFSISITLFLSIKYLFNRCYNNYRFELLECSTKESIEDISYKDLIKVWRKYLSTIIWLSSSMLIIALIFTNLFTTYKTLFEWFNIYYLLLFILLSGYFSLVILSSRLKQVKISKC